MFLSDLNHAMTPSVDNLTSASVRELLSEKYILILGDSVIRGIYKDLVKFSQTNDLLTEDDLRIKGENHFCGDRLVHGGIQKGLTNGTEYEEIREYRSNDRFRFRIRFYFLTRSYSSYMKNIVFHDIQKHTTKPDIIIMSSCLWDISRYGLSSMKSYQQNLDRIMGSFRQMLPDTLFLWLSALPVSNSSKGDVIITRAEYIRPILPGLIRDGNFHCSQLSNLHDILYIDLHTHFSTMLHLRRPDGIHWSTSGNRLMNEIILSHIQAYYHGAKNIRNSPLRRELESKIHRLKQQIRNEKIPLKRNYLNESFSSDDNHENNNSENLKRKRKTTDDDDDKENHRKVVVKTDQQMIIIKKFFDLPNETEFDHNFCDIMFDNEYEGLHLLHFSPSDIEPIDEIDDVKHDYIILSSDDEDDMTPQTILPIYLLNHLEYSSYLFEKSDI